MTTTFTDRPACPNPACVQSHVVKNGRLKGVQRYHCRACGTWFSHTTGTPLYHLHTPAHEIALALKIVMERGSLRAAERLTGTSTRPSVIGCTWPPSTPRRSPRSWCMTWSSARSRSMSSGPLSNKESAPPTA